MPPLTDAPKRRPAPDRRARLVTRLWRAAEAQMRALESRLAALDPGMSPGEAEAKALGGLARLVKDLTALDVAATQNGGEADGEGNASQAERAQRLRDEIARRLAGLDAPDEALAAGGADAG